MGPCVSSSHTKKKYMDQNCKQQRENCPPQNDAKFQFERNKKLKQSSANIKKDKQIKLNLQSTGYKISFKPLDLHQEQYRNFTNEQNSSTPSPKKIIKDNNFKTKNSNSTHDSLNKRINQGTKIQDKKLIQQEQRILQILKKNKRISKIYRKVCQKMTKYNNQNQLKNQFGENRTKQTIVNRNLFLNQNQMNQANAHMAFTNKPLFQLGNGQVVKD